MFGDKSVAHLDRKLDREHVLKPALKKVSLKHRLLPLSLAISLGACSSMDIHKYEENQPKLDPKVFFSGKLTAHGIIKNRQGEMVRYFNADLEGSWQDNKGILDEKFIFNDGEVQYRKWVLEPQGDNTYIGSAEDVVGPAEIKTSGNAMFLDYVLRIPRNDSTIDITIDDKMYLVSENVLINESVMTKWGFEVGSITLTIIKH